MISKTNQNPLRIEALMQAVQEQTLHTASKSTEQDISKLNDTLIKMKNKKIDISQKLSSKVAHQLEKKENTKIIKEDLRQWLPVMKKNREAEFQDFRQDVNKDNFRMQTSANTLSNKGPNAQSKILNKLQEMDMDTEANLKKRETNFLENLEADERREKIDALVNHKNLSMYKETKLKKMKKIKSKLYRQIRKKKKFKEEGAKLEMMAEQDPKLRFEQLEKLEIQRARERITQKHKNNSAYVKQIRKYNGEKNAQIATSELQSERRKLLRKLNMNEYNELMDSDDSDFDEKNFEGEAIAELEKEFGEIDDPKTTSGPQDIVEKLLSISKQNLKKEAKNLIGKLKSGKSLEDDLKSEEDSDINDSEMSDTERRQKKKDKKKLDEEKARKVDQEALKEKGRKKFTSNAIIVENLAEQNY